MFLIHLHARACGRRWLGFQSHRIHTSSIRSANHENLVRELRRVRKRLDSVTAELKDERLQRSKMEENFNAVINSVQDDYLADLRSLRQTVWSDAKDITSSRFFVLISVFYLIILRF